MIGSPASPASTTTAKQPAIVSREEAGQGPPQTVRELERLTSLLQTLTESLSVGVLVEDERVILHANQHLCDLFGIPKPSLILGTDCSAAARAASGLFADPASFSSRIEELLAAGQVSKGEELRLRDGRFLERDYVPVLLQGDVRGHLWQYRDITERKRAEQERLQAMQQAHELERLREMDHFKTDFINMAAHDLAAPLRLIKYQLEVLQDPGGDRAGEEHDRALHVMERNLDRIGQFLDEMLDAVRLQASRLEVRREPIDLALVIRESTDAFREAARDVGLALELKIPDALPAAGDARRVKQVLDNLLSNAANFTPRGGRIEIEARAGPTEAVVSVRDTGIGLSASQVRRLFQPFTQVHAARPNGRAGTGLGLYICKGIVELQGGTMWCESGGEGRGSAFHFTVPLSIPGPSTSPLELTRSSG